ncbi:MAG: 50S ribosomal protein L18 [Patescibacteria group bacterium]
MSKITQNHPHSTRRDQRRRRVRGKIFGTAARPRLAMSRSNRWLYVQLINDEAGRTLLGLSNQKMKAVKNATGGQKKVLLAKQLGAALAKQALTKKIERVVFDRQGYRYAGRVKALAEAARAGGLIF